MNHLKYLPHQFGRFESEAENQKANRACAEKSYFKTESFFTYQTIDVSLFPITRKGLAFFKGTPGRVLEISAVCLIQIRQPENRPNSYTYPTVCAMRNRPFFPVLSIETKPLMKTRLRFTLR